MATTSNLTITEHLTSLGRRDFMSRLGLLIWPYQAGLILLTYLASFLLRFDFAPGRNEFLLFADTAVFILVVKLAAFRIFGLSRGWWRYAGLSDLVDITKAAGVSSIVLYIFIKLILQPAGFPRSILPIDFALTILIIGGARFVVRAHQETFSSNGAQKRTLIVGAGKAGGDIVRELRRNPGLDYKPIGFVDDDRSKTGIKIHGVKVLGTTAHLNEFLALYHIQCVLIAIPSAKGILVEEIISKCKECKVEFRIVPAFAERLNQPVSVSQVRSVQVEDLLGRKPVRLDLENISKNLCGKVVLITGAGGSIGSELARQVAAFQPQKIVLLDRSESDLFKICMELSNKFPGLDYIPAIGDILDVKFLRDIFSQHHPASVFHAAAYKHVPLMEQNCCQAVTNNIFGTYNVAMVAKHYQTGDFVMISSDKAVHPTNVMGATKRVAELIILGLQNHSTRFTSVRFGNVLGSNGSVLPIFQQQIAAAGPVTVTHPEAARFFMTIPEAVQLVLQASSMGKGGEIFVLNMGQPVKIVDLARKVIQLSGFEPDEIKIVYTGLRPGEKLHEEFMLENEGIKPTSHNDIRVLDGGYVGFPQVRIWLDELSDMVESKNVHGVISKLKEIVPEYVPSPEVLSTCEVDRHDVAMNYTLERARLERFTLAA